MAINMKKHLSYRHAFVFVLRWLNIPRVNDWPELYRSLGVDYRCPVICAENGTSYCALKNKYGKINPGASMAVSNSRISCSPSRYVKKEPEVILDCFRCNLQFYLLDKVERALPNWLTGIISVVVFLCVVFIAFLVNKVWCDTR